MKDTHEFQPCAVKTQVSSVAGCCSPPTVDVLVLAWNDPLLQNCLILQVILLSCFKVFHAVPAAAAPVSLQAMGCFSVLAGASNIAVALCKHLPCLFIVQPCILELRHDIF